MFLLGKQEDPNVRPDSSSHWPADGNKNNNAAASIVSASMLVRGVLTSSGDFHVAGTVEGDVRCGRLVITETGAVSGDVVAQEVRIHGRFNGQIRAICVVLCAGSQVEGNISQSVLRVEQGARFDGRCDRTAEAVDAPTHQEPTMAALNAVAIS